MSVLVQLVPVGSAPRNIIRDFTDPIREVFTCEAKITEALGDPKYAFNKDRKQYHSTAILRRLTALRSNSAAWVLGIADVDLFVPERPYVFGEADRESRTAIVSLARLRESASGPLDSEVLRRRGCVEALHEVGHLAGLSHCDEAKCIMFFAATVSDADRKNNTLCNDCRNELGRMERLAET
jgi:archaemetzincin